MVWKIPLVHLLLSLLNACESFFAHSVRLDIELQNTLRPPGCPSKGGLSCISGCSKHMSSGTSSDDRYIICNIIFSLYNMFTYTSIYYMLISCNPDIYWAYWNKTTIDYDSEYLHRSISIIIKFYSKPTCISSVARDRVLKWTKCKKKMKKVKNKKN